MGWTVPSVVDEAGALIAGHGRVLAAKKLKLKEVPLVVARGWSEAQKAAYVLADNKLALNADWDTDVLQAEIGSLESMGFDLALTGFTLTDLEPILGHAPPSLPASSGIEDAPTWRHRHLQG
jgi:ParB-like chromosome segregation protein Spo0J